MSKIFLSFLTACCLCLSFSAQVKVRIIDMESHQPVGSAEIFSEAREKIGTTDENGYFIVNQNTNKILIRAAGFDERLESIGQVDKNILLLKKNKKYKNDPKAVQIVKKVWKNKGKNSPESLKNYQYSAYVKISVDASSDSVKYIENPHFKLDSLNNSLKEALKNNVIFVGERTMLYKYDRRYGKKNIITAYKAGGFDNPEFYNTAAAQTLENDFPEVLSPFGRVKNTFKLIDSVEINGRKNYEIYMFSRRKSGLQFYQSLTFFVDSQTFALTRFYGNASQVTSKYYEVSRVRYKNIWHTEFEFLRRQLLSENFVRKLNRKIPVRLHSFTRLNTVATVKAYVSDFESDVDFSRKEFNGYEYMLSPEVSSEVDKKLLSERQDSLSLREQSSYLELNKLSDKYNLERTAQVLSSLSTGELELGKFNLDLFKLVSHNLYEGFRFQVGGHTNYRWNNDYQLGGFVAKGTKDKDVKAGADVLFFVNRANGGELGLEAETDVLPAGRIAPKYLTPKDELTAKPNNIYNDHYFSYRKIETFYQQDFFRNLTASLSVDYQRQRTEFNYLYKSNPANTWYDYFNTSVKLRYAPNVQYMATPTGKRTLKDVPPYYYLTYTKSWNMFEHGTSAQKVYVSAIYNFHTFSGSTLVVGNAGAIFGNTPLMNTFESMGTARNGNSFLGRFGLKGFQSFETMIPSTFFANNFISIHIYHHLKPIRISEFKYLRFSLVYNGIIGTMDNKNIHHSFDFQVPENYYQEAGIELNKFILGVVGIGAYVRLGAYQTGSLYQNLYVKAMFNL
ncbi:MAG: hypothetical protein LBT29_07070 [Flavobacteriaceae bacterium]|jgi:hypothetical protein|nr:hypothetical protein [Flavobacteriaceae bacterium]